MSWRIRVAGALIAIATALGGRLSAGAQAPRLKDFETMTRPGN